jgi:STE24 endopeptidase
MVQSWLMLRQHRALKLSRSQVPAAFRANFSLTEHQKAIDYGVARLEFGLARMWFKGIVLAVWLLSGWFEVLNLWTLQQFSHPILQALVLIALISLVDGVLGLPWSMYSQFKLEERFGFNRMTLKIFFADVLRGTVLGTVLMAMLGAPIIALMSYSPTYWWLPAFFVYMSFQFLLMWLWPTLIAPLFNKFTPLADLELAHGIEKLVQEAGFHGKGVFVMDASKRSSHGNAYFTGFGKNKRIVFFDTLLQKLTNPQTLAVLAHEVGHLAHGHIKKGLVLSLVMSAAGFWILGVFSNATSFITDLGVTVSHGSILILAGWLASLISWPITPVMSWWSRKHEFEADRYAVKRTSPQGLGDALLELYRGNSGPLVVDPIYAAWNFSHPPLSERLKAMGYPAKD